MNWYGVILLVVGIIIVALAAVYDAFNGFRKQD